VRREVPSVGADGHIVGTARDSHDAAVRHRHGLRHPSATGGEGDVTKVVIGESGAQDPVRIVTCRLSSYFETVGSSLESEVRKPSSELDSSDETWSTASATWKIG
jgi:hypothetical protein